MSFLEQMFQGDLELDQDSEFAIPRCVYIMLVKRGDKIIARPQAFFSEDAAIEYANKVSVMIEEKITDPVEIEVIQHGVEEQNAYRDLVGASWKKTVNPNPKDLTEQFKGLLEVGTKPIGISKIGPPPARGIWNEFKGDDKHFQHLPELTNPSTIQRVNGTGISQTNQYQSMRDLQTSTMQYDTQNKLHPQSRGAFLRTPPNSETAVLF